MGHLEWVLVGQVVFFGSIACMLLLSSKRHKKRKKSKVGDKNLQELDLGISTIRDEAQNLLRYLEQLTGEAPPLVRPNPRDAKIEELQKQLESARHTAESSQGEIRNLSDKLSALMAELEKAKVTAGDAAQLQAARAEAGRLNAENQTLKVQLEEAKKQPPPAASSVDPKEVAELKSKIQFLEKQLQEYAVIEEDIANVRKLKEENDRLKAGGAVASAPVAEPAVAASPVETPSASAAQPAPATLSSEELEAAVAAATAPEAAAVPTPPPAAPAQAATPPEAPAEAGASDPFAEFDKIIQEFDTSAKPEPKAEPAAAAAPAATEPAAEIDESALKDLEKALADAEGGAAAAPAMNQAAGEFTGKPNEVIEEEFNKFVE